MADPTEELSEKKLRKLEKNSDARMLDPWERYRALIDTYEAFFDMNELADRKTRFALVMMGALNALNVIQVGELCRETAEHVQVVARVTDAKFKALERVYNGLTAMTTLSAIMVTVIAIYRLLN